MTIIGTTRSTRRLGTRTLVLSIAWYGKCVATAKVERKLRKWAPPRQVHPLFLSIFLAYRFLLHLQSIHCTVRRSSQRSSSTERNTFHQRLDVALRKGKRAERDDSTATDSKLQPQALYTCRHSFQTRSSRPQQHLLKLHIIIRPSYDNVQETERLYNQIALSSCSMMRQNSTDLHRACDYHHPHLPFIISDPHAFVQASAFISHTMSSVPCFSIFLGVTSAASAAASSSLLDS